MTDNLANDIIGLITSVVSNFQVVVALLLIVVIAACFLGRQVELSKKLVLSAFGVTGVSLICIIIFNLFFADADNNLILLLDYILAGALYVYAFVFFLIAFKEKRLKRAIFRILRESGIRTFMAGYVRHQFPFYFSPFSHYVFWFLQAEKVLYYQHSCQGIFYCVDSHIPVHALHPRSYSVRVHFIRIQISHHEHNVRSWPYYSRTCSSGFRSNLLG